MPKTSDPAQLLAAAQQGERAALARLLSMVERGGEPARHIARIAHAAVASGGPGSDAVTVGITGAPGAGKSTLTAAMVSSIRATIDQVAVLAVDPTSPFSGGAILGDRVRMQAHATDRGVFIRSMATRGRLGGLALATPAAVRVLGASGWPLVIIETVGVGQVEVDIVGSADTTVVVVNPGWGDSVQANKAGLLEIADVFVINKADRPGADAAERDLRQMLELGIRGEWEPPIVHTTAVSGEGVPELLAEVDRHQDHLRLTGSLDQKRRERERDEVRDIVDAILDERIADVLGGAAGTTVLAALARGDLDPYAAADAVLDAAFGPAGRVRSDQAGVPVDT